MVCVCVCVHECAAGEKERRQGVREARVLSSQPAHLTLPPPSSRHCPAQPPACPPGPIPCCCCCRTRLHSVPSAFQLVTVAVVLRNMRKPWVASLSAASRNDPHRGVLVLARNSSIRRCPMLCPLQRQSMKQQEIEAGGWGATAAAWRSTRRR